MRRFLTFLCTITTIALMGAGTCWASPEGDDLIKVVRSGVDEEVLLAYIRTSPDTFSLSADDIITLKDLGVSSKVIAEALLHGHPSDSAAAAQAREQVHAATSDTAIDTTGAAMQPREELSSAAAVAPPPDDQNISFFYQALDPYGTWMQVDGEWCWQPNATVVNPDWAPYCRHGHWAYSDWGWCWMSDYSWGWAPFHYGRWFHHSSRGWCWVPDNQWGPAWVLWRHDGDYCGWAPLPPHSRIERDGFYFNNAHVEFDFSFNLASTDFFFLPTRNFCDPHPWVHIVPSIRADQIYRRTAFDRNAYGFQQDHFFNRGPAADEISRITNRRITPITVVQDNIRPGQLIHRGIVRNNQLLIYKPAISAVAPRTPSVVKTMLEKNGGPTQPRREFISGSELTRQVDVAKQVLKVQSSTADAANRENLRLNKAAQNEGDANKRSALQGEAAVQAMKAQQASRHAQSINRWSAPSASQPVIVPQSRVYPQPKPEQQQQVRTQVRAEVNNEAVRERQQQRNAEETIRRPPPTAAPQINNSGRPQQGSGGGGGGQRRGR